MEQGLFGDGFRNVDASRRLPVYLLLDTSLSMNQNDAIGQVRSGVDTLKSVLEGMPEAVQTVWIKVISFDGGVHPTPLRSLTDFQPPQLSTAPGGTVLAQALRQLDQDARFGHDLKENTDAQKGDYLPIVFVLTDGQPTDQPTEYNAAAEAIHQRVERRQMNVIAVACGPDAPPDKLKQITPNVFVMRTMTNQQWGQLFAWVSQSVAARSVTVSRSREENPVTEMPPPPPGLVLY